MRLACERCLITLGEAARQMPAELQALAPDVPWRLIADQRNFLVHAYRRVDPRVVWRTLRAHALPLHADLEAALAKLAKTG